MGAKVAQLMAVVVFGLSVWTACGSGSDPVCAASPTMSEHDADQKC
jgi:hypothetical protein